MMVILEVWLCRLDMLLLRGGWQATEQMKNILWLVQYDIVM